MLDLPRRSKLIDVSIDVEEGTVTMQMEPLTDSQYLQLNESADIGADRIIFRLSRQDGLFEDRLRSIAGVQIDGQPFDTGDPEHLSRIPQPWKSLGLTRLLRYAMGLTADELGNSKPPADPSPADETDSKG